MELNDIIGNPYFDKIILSLIPFVLKGILGKEDDAKPLKKFAQVIFLYVFPLATIIWINLDIKIENNKLTSTLIVLNFCYMIFNYFHQKLIDHYKLITKFTNVETDKIKQINQINDVQVEKLKAINDNQKYILSEISRINDRIITFIGTK